MVERPAESTMALLKSLMLPPSGLVLLILVGLLLRRRWPRLASLCVAAGAGAVFLLSLPAVGTSLLMLHQDYPPIAADGLSAPAGVVDAPKAIVVLGADFDFAAPEYGTPQPTSLTFERLNYAAFLQRRTALPLLVSAGSVVASEEEGAVVMKRALEEMLNISVTFVEKISTNTWENAVYSAEILKGEGIGHVYLVTHAWHMPRAKRAFEHHGITVTPAPTAFATRPGFGLFDWLPNARALRSSYFFFHEALGRIAYRFRES